VITVHFHSLLLNENATSRERHAKQYSQAITKKKLTHSYKIAEVGESLLDKTFQADLL